jgi:integrase/recombinase XerD
LNNRVNGTQNPPVLSTVGVQLPLPAPRTPQLLCFKLVTEVIFAARSSRVLLCPEEHGMANRRVTIWIGGRVGGQFRYLKPAKSANNKIRPGWGIFRNHPVELESYRYYIHNYVGKRHSYSPVGEQPQSAVWAAERQEIYLKAQAMGLTDINPPENGNALSLAAAVDGYLTDLEKAVANKSKKQETFNLTKQTLEEFQSCCKKTYIKDVTKNDVMDYSAWVQKRENNGNAPRTAANKFMRVAKFLRTSGMNLVTQKDAPKYDEAPVEVYEAAELENFFAACSPRQRITVQTFHLCGLRMQELMYLTWQEIEDGFVHVQRKDAYPDFTPKAYHERKVPIPPELLKSMQEMMETPSFRKGAESQLVFPTSGGRPNGKLLQTCKRIAHRAGLNCGHCENVGKKGKQNCRKHAVCGRWFLHKFRANFATELLQGRNGDPPFSIEDVRYLMGHKDLESIQRYVAFLKSNALKNRIAARYSASIG